MLDYTEQEIRAVQETLNRQYQDDIKIFLADCEVQPHQNSQDIVERPALFWNTLYCNFVIVKMDHNRFEGRYFYEPQQQLGQQSTQYADAANCVLALLKEEAKHARESRSVHFGATGTNLTQ